MPLDPTQILTLTLSPAVDKSSSVAGIVPDHKLHCAPPVFEPGGGGINVSRGLQRLGVSSRAVFPAGGPVGLQLQQLLTAEGIAQQAVPITGNTRENFTVVDTTTGQQFRFGMPGTPLTSSEQQQILDFLRTCLPVPAYWVISGSLPPGVAPDFLEEVLHLAKARGVKVIADTSGPALQRMVEAGVYLIKPNLRELSQLVGAGGEIESAQLAPMARRLIGAGRCEVVVASLGPQGACLITHDLEDHIPAPAVPRRSTVGAGDSMVAGIVYGLVQGLPLREAARLGVACGTAATMNPGTELFHKADVDRLYHWLRQAMPAAA
ncbi:1-phosphofructokinase family hexose kinase [Hymenobacter sp. BT730]|uniref:1-phosphofructokinase family hexose kinase n=1 Tax=Hymenobacter sp. BT730 TaxID=3063332 RepID=UPI0026DF9999|nr:1-phosphofructokinase family hexose kinase [Hymenobacter sp. BT730]